MKQIKTMEELRALPSGAMVDFQRYFPVSPRGRGTYHDYHVLDWETKHELPESDRGASDPNAIVIKTQDGGTHLIVIFDKRFLVFDFASSNVRVKEAINVFALSPREAAEVLAQLQRLAHAVNEAGVLAGSIVSPPY